MGQITSGLRLGPYEIVSPIGSGGMGQVYKARDTRLDRSVAIKILPPDLSEDASLRLRFEREARTLSQLNHPHICTVHDVGEALISSPSAPDDTLVRYLVMELLEGQSLAERLSRGPLPPSDVLRCGAEVADALGCAHRAGVVHRDLKPANVMLTKSGAKLLDFGLARQATPAVSWTGGDGASLPTAQKPLTREGTILGTFQYMAPEQLEGREADHRTDIFALGALLYELSTGKRAFEGKTKTSLIAAIVSGEPKPMVEIQPLTPPVLERVVRKCLQKDPDERWQSAADVAEILRSLVEAPARRVVGPRSLRQRLAGAAWPAAALGALAGGYVFGTQSGRPAASEAVEFEIALPESGFDRGPHHRGSIAVSPDGRHVAYRVGHTTESTADHAPEGLGAESLWLRSLASSETHRLLPGTEGGRLPFWSPDSRHLAFFANGKLKRIEIVSGEVQTICDAGPGGGGSWSSKGIIAFAPHVEGGLLRVSAAGGQPAPLTALDPARGDTHHLWPWFLPDGERFLFAVWAPRAGGMYVGSVASAEQKRLVPYGKPYDISAVAYAPSGHLLYLRDRVLLAHPFDVRTVEVHGTPRRLAERLDFGGPGMSAFGVSGTGVLAYRKATGPPLAQLLWIDGSGGELGDVSAPDRITSVSLAPNGRVAAVTKDPVGEFPSVWLVDLGRGTQTRFSGEHVWAGEPQWSPDGTRILFSSADDSPPNLFVREVDRLAGSTRLMRANQQTYGRSWAPDGSTIVYQAFDNDTGWDLFALSLAGSRTTPLIRTRFDESGGTISPDGRWLAYTSSESGRPEVYVTRYPEPRGKWQVSASGGSDPQWSPDGRRLYFRSPGDALVSVDVSPGPVFAASAERRLATIRMSSYAVAGPDRILVAKLVGPAVSPPVTVVLNWRARLED